MKPTCCGKQIPYSHEKNGTCGHIYYGAVLRCNDCLDKLLRVGQRVRYVGPPSLWADPESCPRTEGRIESVSRPEDCAVVRWDSWPDFPLIEKLEYLERIK